VRSPEDNAALMPQGMGEKTVFRQAQQPGITGKMRKGFAAVCMDRHQASWNFKHIVSINPIRKIHELNKKNNCAAIEIGSLQIFGGAKYGNI